MTNAEIREALGNPRALDRLLDTRAARIAVLEELLSLRAKAPVVEMIREDLPLCCYADTEDPLEIHLYAAYHRGGPPERRGRDEGGQICLSWEEMPEIEREKWRTAADAAVSLLLLRRGDS